MPGTPLAPERMYFPDEVLEHWAEEFRGAGLHQCTRFDHFLALHPERRGALVRAAKERRVSGGLMEVKP